MKVASLPSGVRVGRLTALRAGRPRMAGVGQQALVHAAGETAEGGQGGQGEAYAEHEDHRLAGGAGHLTQQHANPGSHGAFSASLS